MKKDKKSNLKRIFLFSLIAISLFAFIYAVGYNVVYTNNNNAGIFNQTNVTGVIGISLQRNSTIYNFTSGDFISFVFYNSSNSNYWNINLGTSCRNLTASITCDENVNITLQTRTADSYNISDSGLIAAWGLNNASGENATFFRDETGKYNATCGSATCPKFSPNGTVGSSYLFDGINEHQINLTNAANFTDPIYNAQKITISSWVFPTLIEDAFTKIISQRNSTFTDTTWTLDVDAQGDNFRGIVYNGVGYCLIADPEVYQASKWYNIVYTYNGSNCWLYKNGVLAATAARTAGGGGAIGSSNDVRGTPEIGGVDGIQVWEGLLDEIRIYNRSLSTDEVQNLYQLGSYHMNWNEGNGWNTSYAVNDGIANTTPSYGKFMQFKANFYTNNSMSSPFLLNHSVMTSKNIIFNYLSNENSYAISQFIKVNGTNFTLGGNQYTAIGADAYYLADYATNHTYDDAGNEINGSQIYVDEIRDKAKALNINYIRTWSGIFCGNNTDPMGSDWYNNKSGGHVNCFLNGNTTNYNETIWKALDYVIYSYGLKDIRVMLVPVNNWHDYGGKCWWVQQSSTSSKNGDNETGGTPTDAFCDQFFNDTGTMDLFKEYINYTLNRNNTYTGLKYKDDPRIFGIQLINEPRAKSASGVNKQLIRNWTINMTKYVHDNDPNHVVGLGIEGWGQNYSLTSGEGTDMVIDHNGTGVDFATVELHPDQWAFFARNSENQTNGFMSGGKTNLSLNSTIDWWTTGGGYTFGGQGSGLSGSWTYSPALPRHSYQNWIAFAVNISNQLNMPIILSELALPTTTTAETTTQLTDVQKAKFFDQAINTFFKEGGDVIAMWNFNHDLYASKVAKMDDNYSFYFSSNPLLKTKSQGVIDAYNFTLHNNTGGTSWVTLLNNYNFTLKYNITFGDNSISNCSLYLSVTNQSNQNTGYFFDKINSSTILDSSNGTNSFTRSFSTTDYNFTWYTKCCETINRCYNSNSQFVLLSNVPVITLTYPDNNYISTNTSNFTLNYSVSDGVGISNCDLYINGFLNQTNLTTAININQYFNINMTANASSYIWQIKCTDTSGVAGFSEARTIIYDKGIINLSLISPANNEIFNNTYQNFTINASSFAPIATINLFIDGSLQEVYSVVGIVYTLINSIITSISSTLHTWYYQVIDIYGITQTSDTWNITINTNCSNSGMEGYGNLTSPCQITNWTQLNATKNNLNIYYILINNLSSSSLDYSGYGDNWLPIGDSSNRFRGNFNGNNNTISDLIISSPFNNNIGLFGYVTGSLSNIRLTNSSINTATSNIGILAGKLDSGTITNSSSIGNVSGYGFVGGLTGVNAGGTITNSYSISSVFGSSEYIGGLTGYSSGTITNSYSISSVFGSGGASQYIGGLTGYSSGTITNSYSIINGTIIGIDGVGSLAGYISYSSVINCSSIVETSANITGNGDVGFIGLNEAGTITNSYLTIRNITFGNITFLNLITGGAGNMMDSININNNSVYVNSTQNYLNKSANITLLGIGNRGLGNPTILKDGFKCLDCYNFTSLTEEVVVFNVSGWSNYTIGEGLYPEIYFGNLTLNSSINVSQNFIYINTTHNAVAFGNITYFIGNNISTFTVETPSYNFTNLPDGTYYFNVTFCDASHRCNSTETRYLNLDSHSPNLYINVLTPNPAQFGIDDIIVNWTATDIHLETSFMRVYNSSNSLIFGPNVTKNILLLKTYFTYPDTYTVQIWANDSFGNIAQTASYLGILSVADTLPPRLNINLPINGSSYSSNTVMIPINFRPYDESNLSSAWWYVYGPIGSAVYSISPSSYLNVSNNQTLSTSIRWDQLDGTTNPYVISICSNDTYNNVNCTNISIISTVGTTSGLIGGGGGGGSGNQNNSLNNLIGNNSIEIQKISKQNYTAPKMPETINKIQKSWKDFYDWAVFSLSPDNHALGMFYFWTIVLIIIIGILAWIYYSNNYKINFKL